MPTENHPNADDALREQLVAYLDGELPPAEARALEARLGTDKQCQQELQALERAWGALDGLPQITAGEEFSKTTIEMVAVEAKQEVARLTAAMPVAKRRKSWGAVATAAAALLAGFVLSRLVATSADRQLARDLPVIWGVDTLVQAPDDAFLTRLAAQSPSLIEQHSTCRTEDQAAAWKEVSDASLSERARRVRQLADVERTQLLTSKNRFLVMSPGQQETLRQTHASLQAAAKENPKIYQAALAYNDWVETQPPELQAELRTIEDVDARAGRVAELWGREQEMSRRTLNASDARSLRRAVQQLADREELKRLPTAIKAIRRKFLANARSQGEDPDRRMLARIQDWGKNFDEAVQRRPAMAVALLSRVAFADGRDGRWARMLLGDRAEQLQAQARDDWRAIEPELTAALSPRALRSLDGDSEERRARRLRDWVLESAMAAIEPSSWEEFFASDALSDSERNELLALPRSEMHQRLRRLYFDRELGGMDPRDMREFGPLFGPRDGPGGPRGDRPPPGPPPGPPPRGEGPPRGAA